MNSGTTYPVASVYALLDPGESSVTMNQFAALSTVDGLVYRARWRDLEPTASNYDWSTLDTAFDVVQAQHKHLTIHIGASGGAWPTWLTNVGAMTYTYSGPAGSVTDPLPWDAVYLARYDNFIGALSAHIQSRSAMNLLNAISVGAPIAEMSIVGCQNGVMGGITYDRTSYMSAWLTAIASFRNRFAGATVFVSAPIGVICRPDNDGGVFYLAMMNAALINTTNLAVFAADLNAAGSSRVNQVDATLLRQLDLNLQTIWSATNDPTNRMAGSLQDAVCHGLQLGAGYFEIYKSDLLSADATIRGAIDSARSGRGCP